MGEDFSRELLWRRVFEDIERLGSEKASQEWATKLERRVEKIEREALSPQAIAQLIQDALREKDARGWTARERTFGVVLFAIAIATFGLQLWVAASS